LDNPSFANIDIGYTTHDYMRVTKEIASIK